MIKVVGLGPGKSKYFTEDAIESIKSASVIYGYARHTDMIRDIETSAIKQSYNKLNELSEMILDELNVNPNSKIILLASGDPSLYGIAKYIIDKFEKQNLAQVEIIPGVSSVSYLFSRVKQSMNDLYITSTHAKELSFDTIMNLNKVAFVTDKEKGPAYIANRYLDASIDPYIIVGENLAYEDELITIKRASQLSKNKEYKMCVVIAIKEEAYER